MGRKSAETARNSWIQRILVLLRGAEVWQLREVYYMVAGYLSASRGRVPDRPEGGSKSPETLAQ